MSMIERMARAGGAVHVFDGMDVRDTLQSDYEAFSTFCVDEVLRNMTLAVLAEMRHPTPGMVETGVYVAGMPWRSVVPPGVHPDFYVLSMAFTAMIDAALQEREG